MSWQLFWFIATLVISYATRPRPVDAPVPGGFESLQVPTAEAGREIPVLFGTREIKTPNIVWYGNLRLVRVRKWGGKKA